MMVHARLQRATHPQARSARTRAAILEAAERIFATSGLAGARTDAIAAAAGVNKAMLYYYFQDKDALYQAAIEEHFRAFNQRALAALAAPGPARDVLLRYVGLHLDFLAARHRYAALFQQLMLAGGQPLQTLVRRYFAPRAAALEKLLRRGMRAGEFRRADPRHTAISITAMIVFYFSAARVLPLLGHTDAYSPAQLRRRKREVLDFVRCGLFCETGVLPQ
jgi:TetR/AcrR family transcriptional regulator